MAEEVSGGNEDHARALDAVRVGEWERAISLLGKAADKSGNPWIINDLAAALHQAGDLKGAVEVLGRLGDAAKLPALVRLNRMYMEKALEIEQSFDPGWEHNDLDRLPCPDRPPLVSVVVRTYKRPDLLREALSSLRSQTFSDFETIVINDGGDPGSEKVVRESGLDPARYLMTGHQGRVQALNTGLGMAHGKYITGLDDDDVLYPEHLARPVEYLESPGSAPVVYADYRVVSFQHGEEGGLEPGSAKDYQWGDYRPGILFETNPCSILLMARRTCYEEAGRFCPALDLAEDWEMWLRLAERFEFHHLPAITAEVRERPGDANITYRRLRQKYFWDNLVLFMHRGLALFSSPRRPELATGYGRALGMLEELVGERPEILPLLNLRGLWTMNKAYAWFADQGRWFAELGERELSRDFYAKAAKLDLLQPKLWAGWLRTWKRGDRVESSPGNLEER